MSDKEALYKRGVLTLFDSGGEEDLLAFYLHQGREFPQEPDLLILDNDLWTTVTDKPEFRARKEEDQVSYAWDRLIETLCDDYRAAGLIAEHPYSAKSLSEVEMLIRVMARENRFCRRLLSKAFVDFLELSISKKVKSRIVPSLSGVQYVFLACRHDVKRELRTAELIARCYIARGLNPNARIVIGLVTERPEPGKGFSLGAFYLNKPEWTTIDQEKMETLQRELGFFSNPLQSRPKETEYPGT